MSVLHLLAAGNTGGIETLCKNYAAYSQGENIFVFVWHGGAAAEEMQRLGVETLVLNASKKDFFGPLKTLVRLCRARGVTAVVVHHAAPVNHLYAMYLQKRLGLRYYFYAHGAAENLCRDLIPKGLFFRRQVITAGLRAADGVIAISDYVKNSVAAYYGTSADKITVVYNGTPVQTFSGPITAHTAEVRITYVGRLIPQKGVQNTLAALGQIDPSRPFRFTVVGDGPCRPALEQQAAQVNRLPGRRVEFLGTVRGGAPLLADTDLFVHAPDLQEGFGITVIEAMAAGAGVVCNTSGALPELVRDGETGWLVPQGDIPALAQKLEELIDRAGDPAVLCVRGNARKAAARYDIQTFAKALDAVLNEEKPQ